MRTSRSNAVVLSLLRWGLTLGLFLPAFSGVARADVAVLRDKGPRSGSVFSNPGIAANSLSDLKIAMQTAEVKIRLRLAEGGKLAADCVAMFDFDDLSQAQAGTRTFLVAFPVTGLNSKIVTVEQFRVTVDGKDPPLVFRHAIEISRRRWQIADTPVKGQLDACYAPDNKQELWKVFLSDRTGYRGAYVWQQDSQPGARTHVCVTYTVILRPQSIHYTKSYESADDDEEVIPFQDIPIDKWKDQYFFFDYVLLSGATWDGPIGRETIELSAEPALRLDLSQILVVPRSPVGFRPRGLPIDGGEWSETMVLDGIRRWVIEKTKPDSDLLLAIPASMIKSEAPSASK